MPLLIPTKFLIHNRFHAFYKSRSWVTPGTEVWGTMAGEENRVQLSNRKLWKLRLSSVSFSTQMLFRHLFILKHLILPKKSTSRTLLKSTKMAPVSDASCYNEGQKKTCSKCWCIILITGNHQLNVVSKAVHLRSKLCRFRINFP